jgi:glycosyltransferase involved in cell wall biosynthesis
MKVLYISNGYPPHRWAGTETYTAGIAGEIHARGHQVQVLCAGDWDTGTHYWNGFTDDFHQEIPVRRLNLNWTKSPDPAKYFYNNPLIGEYVKNYLGEIQPDLVHVTSCETLSASVLEVVKASGLPSVLSLTDYWFLCPQINLLRSDGQNCNGKTNAWECLRCRLWNSKAYHLTSRYLGERSLSRLLLAVSQYPLITRQRGLRGMAGNMTERKAYLKQTLNQSDFRITASRFAHDLFVGIGIEAPIMVKPYGHDLSWMDSYHGKTPSPKIRIGFIGQIVSSKGVHLLLEAAACLYESFGEKFNLIIYGDLNKKPDYSSILHSLATKIDNVQFRGTYLHGQSSEVYAGIDILVVPSLWYDFPLIIYEAFATKTPVVATNLGGMAEAVTHNVNGLLFERGNVDDLTKQLRRFFEEKDLLGKLRAGIPRVKKIEEEVDELEQIYWDQTKSHPRRKVT